MTERMLVDAEALSTAISGLDGWKAEDNELKKSWKFENFAESLAFVNRVGELAEAADHHPDIKFGWGYAEISLTTHDRGGITDVDISLATQIDRL